MKVSARRDIDESAFENGVRSYVEPVGDKDAAQGLTPPRPINRLESQI